MAQRPEEGTGGPAQAGTPSQLAAPNPKCQIPNAKCQIPHLTSCIPNSKCQIPHPKCQIPNPRSHTWHGHITSAWASMVLGCWDGDRAERQGQGHTGATGMGTWPGWEHGWDGDSDGDTARMGTEMVTQPSRHWDRVPPALHLGVAVTPGAGGGAPCRVSPPPRGHPLPGIVPGLQAGGPGGAAGGSPAPPRSAGEGLMRAVCACSPRAHRPRALIKSRWHQPVWGHWGRGAAGTGDGTRRLCLNLWQSPSGAGESGASHEAQGWGQPCPRCHPPDDQDRRVPGVP